MLKLAILILWPSFLVAAAMEGLFFSFVDPNDLNIAGNSIELSPKAIYTLGFFVFWVFCSLSSMLTYSLTQTPVNEHPPF